MAVSETVFSTIDDFPKTGSGFGVVRNPLTLYEGFTIPEYSRCIFINYTNSNDGALIAIISDKTYTAFRNNGKWQSGRILVTNTDLQAHWPKVLHFNIEANTYKTIKEQGSNRFSQLLFLQTANTNGYGLYLLSGYGNDGGTNRYYISEIASGSQFNIEVSKTSFKVTNSNYSTATVALVSFMGDIPTIQ